MGMRHGERGGICISVRQHFEYKDGVKLTNLMGLHCIRTSVLSCLFPLKFLATWSFIGLPLYCKKINRQMQVHWVRFDT